MPCDPDDDPVPVDPESVFLIALWDRLEQASELSIGPDVMTRLDEVLSFCEQACGLIRAWQVKA